MLDIAQRRAKEGKRSDALWVLDLANDHAPDLCTGTRASQSFRVKVRDVQEPERIKYKPSDEEIKTGGPAVDEDVYVISTPAMEDAWRRTYQYRSRYT